MAPSPQFDLGKVRGIKAREEEINEANALVESEYLNILNNFCFGRAVFDIVRVFKRREFDLDLEPAKPLVEDRNNSRRNYDDDDDDDDDTDKSSDSDKSSESDESSHSDSSDDTETEEPETPSNKRDRKCCLCCACCESNNKINQIIILSKTV
ncbi:hypothetical protein EGR_00744 [Echinococcus granulosus]|uniref:Uncharacterized protein n=1 Tax=Echinococcus granulosus TaxID=6210 RepID=W6UR54_ECHGR|nr:hypothetical protein EGR_00744 [Echinococcus granulosus]EUB64200.1 hypothetical protein EGR_00744 [Echinococcus granulosus]